MEGEAVERVDGEAESAAEAVSRLEAENRFLIGLVIRFMGENAVLKEGVAMLNKARERMEQAVQFASSSLVNAPSEADWKDAPPSLVRHFDEIFNNAQRKARERKEAMEK